MSTIATRTWDAGPAMGTAQPRGGGFMAIGEMTPGGA